MGGLVKSLMHSAAGHAGLFRNLGIGHAEHKVAIDDHSEFGVDVVEILQSKSIELFIFEFVLSCIFAVVVSDQRFGFNGLLVDDVEQSPPKVLTGDGEKVFTVFKLLTNEYSE